MDSMKVTADKPGSRTPVKPHTIQHLALVLPSTKNQGETNFYCSSNPVYAILLEQTKLSQPEAATSTHTHIHTHIHAHTYTQTHNIPQTHTHNTHTCTHTYKYIHTHAHTHTNTHIHTCTHIHTNTYTHTHTNTYTHTKREGSGVKDTQSIIEAEIEPRQCHDCLTV